MIDHQSGFVGGPPSCKGAKEWLILETMKALTRLPNLARLTPQAVSQMADRVVSIELMADATGVVRGTAAARDAVGELRDEVNSSAMSQRQAWATVGTGLTAVGVAMTGIGVAAMKTGVQYNTLQQTTRAALSTLLGSAQAANAQMDKLDEFARNSPFAKQTFIQAQQQMLGFGVATEKVMPALSAIQDTVAAFGGTNEQISSIVDVLSRLQSQGRLSGDALERLGYYGVDAAKIIGDEMGMTSGEIKDMASKPGGIPVDQIWDPLVTGMENKFGGAAANVKETFAGAMDRVKAAWRDFAADLAKPLVDPDGGGALIDLLNWAADAMRTFEALPGPVKATVTAMGGLAGAGTLAAGAMILGLPKWWEFQRALRATNLAGGRLDRTMRGLGKVAGAAAAWGTLIALSKEAEANVTALNNSLERGSSATESLGKAAEAHANRGWGGMTAGLREVKVDADAVSEAMDYLQQKADKGIFMTTPINLGDIQGTLGSLKTLGDEMANLSETSMPKVQASLQDLSHGFNWSAEEQWRFIENSPALKQALEEQAGGFDLTTSKSDLLKIAFGGAKQASDENTDALGELSSAAEEAMQTIDELADEILNFGSAQIDSERAAIAFEEQISALNERVAEGVGGLDISTEAGQANRQSLLDMADATNKAASAALNAGEGQDVVNGKLSRGRQALIDAAVAYGMGEKEAKSYADQVIATPGTVTTWFRNNAEQAAAAVEVYKNAIDSIRDTVSTTIRVAMEQVGSVGGEKHATGGTVGYASGGTIGGVAGLSVVGIGGGVMNGTVFGRGTTTSDSVNVNLSRGEEVIRASEATKHRGLLKQINSGQFNRGDFVSSPTAPQTIIQKVVEVPTHLSVVDPGSGLVTTMKVVANDAVDLFVKQQATANRRAG